MSIQTEILDTIGDGGLEVSALRGKLGNIGANELDCAINALLRARRVRIEHNRYEVIPSTRPLGGLPHTGRPPSAEEEAAASLLQPVSRVCITCGGKPQALHEFRFVGPGEARAKECNTCHGKKTQAGQAKQRGKIAVPIAFHSAQKPTDNNGTEVLKVGHQTVNLAASATAGSSPAGSTKPTQREGDNRDVSTEHSQAAAVPETSGSYSRSDPSEDARTPASAERVSPVVESVLERVRARRQNALNRIVVLAVEVENLSGEVRDCERFVELWERFAGVQQ